MIEVNNISKEFISPKKYPGLKGAIKGLFSTEKEKKTAVDDISFSIADGEIVGYIGSNGAGKSTTIKMMTGILKPTKGECLIDGINPAVNRMANAARIGVVFGQRTQLWWDLPLSESYTILKEIYDVSDEDFKKQLDFLNNTLGLEEFFHKTVRTLSLGQRMRADLGAALIHNPKVLYLDEPTIGLDLVVKDKIRDAILEINEKYNTTVILTTHDIEDIEKLCNRIIVIDKGRKIYDGTLTDLKETYGTTRKISVKTEDFPGVDQIKRALGAKELTINFNEAENRLEISFDKNQVEVSDIIAALIKIIPVKDIRIQETELASIVKDIYTHSLGNPSNIQIKAGAECDREPDAATDTKQNAKNDVERNAKIPKKSDSKLSRNKKHKKGGGQS